eukprot:Opistho-2@46519
MAKRGKYQYTRLGDGNDDFTDEQFVRPPPKVPIKAILLATALFLFGSLFIVMGSLIMTGVIETSMHDRAIPFLVLGSLLFIPGFYHVRIAYYTWKQYPGYSYDDIPDFD